MEEFVILVDENDRETGKMEKMQAHMEAVLHRAFSVFIFNSEGKLLLQRRALTKYHSPGLWTNTCCSHPRPGETTAAAAHRRMVEEMGFDCSFDELFSFVYKAAFDNNLTEHEFDHVFAGSSDQVPHPDPSEVESFRYATMEEIREEMQADPSQFTVWFRIAFDRVDQFAKSGAGK